MKTLSEKIRKNGFDYTLVCREPKKAVYCQHVTPNLQYFEVFIVKQNKERTIAGNFIEAGEAFPSDSDFGETAWTCTTIERAMQVYNELETTHQKYFNNN